MSLLAPDEKVCPFCAEIIKVAAVKCRYCHSDLPVEAPSDATAVAVPEQAPELGVPPSTPGTTIRETAPQAAAVPGLLPPTELVPLSGSQLAAPKLTSAVIVLILACLLLAGGSMWLLLTDGSDQSFKPQVVQAGGSAGLPSTASAAARAGAISAATSNATTILSYSYLSIPQDEQRARALLAPEYLDQYAAVMKVAAPEALSAKLTLTAMVQASSLVSIGQHKAVALVFVNAKTVSATSKQQQINGYRVLMTMTRKDDRWIVSNIDAF
jgi:hypothetical protein